LPDPLLQPGNGGRAHQLGEVGIAMILGGHAIEARGGFGGERCGGRLGSLDGGGPLLLAGHFGDEAPRERIDRVECLRGLQHLARALRTDPLGEEARSQHQPELEPRHAEGGLRAGHAARTGADQVHARTKILAVRENHRIEGRVPHRLQQLLDPDEAQQEVAFRLALVAAHVESGAEVLAVAPQDEEASPVGIGAIHGC
jgi:hypothetical protein